MNKTPLLQVILSALVDGELPDSFSLPSNNNEDGFSFADGAQDGIYIYHMSHDGIDTNDTKLIKEAIIAISNRDYNRADELFLDVLQRNTAISIIGVIQNYIWDNTDELDADNIYKYATETIRLSDDKELIKCSLTILGLLDTNNLELKNIIRTLALSDEFTLYCVYIIKTWPNSNSEIFNLVKKVHGWGRIHAVEELRALDPQYDEIRDWILKEGINNNVMPSYSALTCWKYGNVGSTLYTKPTYEQFYYIGKIIDALMDESAVAGLSTLDKRIDIIEVYLNEAKKMPLVTEDYEVIDHIIDYFSETEDGKKIIEMANDIIRSPKARTAILEGVKKGKAIDLAIKLNIDCKPYVLSLLKRSFKDNYHLCRYLSDNDKYRKEMLYEFKKNLPLKQMISVPTDSIGFDDDYYEMALLFLLQELRQYPNTGKEFVETGLQSKYIRTRNAALTVLNNWVSETNTPLSKLSPDLNSLLIILSGLEVDNTIRHRMDRLIKGDTSFEEEVILHDEKAFSQDTLNLLADAISDMGSWRWWNINNQNVQLEFSDVQLYDETKAEKEPHSSVIALRFYEGSFAMFLDNFEINNRKKWYDRLADDEIEPFELDGYELVFNDAKFVNELFETYKNKNIIKDISDDMIVSCKYILAGKCKEVGFVVGGNKMEVVSHHGVYSEEEVNRLIKKWWEYWEDYWRKRNTKDAYQKDFVCELTIPVDLNDKEE